MITADKKYLDKEEEIYPDMETFFNKKSQYYQKCRVYGVYTTCEALNKECSDVAHLFGTRYPNSYSYYGASKIAESAYVVEEDNGRTKYFYPYVPEKTVVERSVPYLDYDSAVLAAIAMKYMNTKDPNKVLDMVMVIEKLIDKPMED